LSCLPGGLSSPSTAGWRSERSAPVAAAPLVNPRPRFFTAEWPAASSSAMAGQPPAAARARFLLRPSASWSTTKLQQYRSEARATTKPRLRKCSNTIEVGDNRHNEKRRAVVVGCDTRSRGPPDNWSVRSPTSKRFPRTSI